MSNNIFMCRFKSAIRDSYMGDAKSVMSDCGINYWVSEKRGREYCDARVFSANGEYLYTDSLTMSMIAVELEDGNYVLPMFPVDDEKVPGYIKREVRKLQIGA